MSDLIRIYRASLSLKDYANNHVDMPSNVAADIASELEATYDALSNTDKDDSLPTFFIGGLLDLVEKLCNGPMENQGWEDANLCIQAKNYISSQPEAIPKAPSLETPDEGKTQRDYEHFLAYSGLHLGTELLRYAYFHGADIGLDRPSKEVRDAIPDLLSEMANYECRDTDTYSISVRIEDWHDRLKAATQPKPKD